MRWEPINWCKNLCFWKMYLFWWASRGWGVDWTLECFYFRDTLHSSKREFIFILLCNLKIQQTTCFSLIITTWDKKQGRNFLCTKTCSTVLSHGACETLGREAVSFNAFSLIQCCHEQAVIAIEEKADVLPLSRAVIPVRPVHQQRKMKRAHLTERRNACSKRRPSASHSESLWCLCGGSQKAIAAVWVWSN